MTLSPGRYLLTLKVQANALGVVPVGTRYTLAVTFRASGRHSYAVTEITPNPGGYALDKGDFEQDGWQDGEVEIIRLALGRKVSAVVKASEGGALEANIADADSGVTLASASGAWRRAKNQADTPPAPTVTASTGAWPWLLLPATCGWYADRANLPATIDAVAALGREHGCAGRLGLDIEGTGDLGNPGADVGALMDAIDQRFAYIANTLMPACALAGVPVKITAGNTNDFGKGFKQAWRDTAANRARYIDAHRKLAVALLPYSKWLIVQAVAEQDSEMKADFRKATQKAWTDAGFPSSRMAAEDREGGAALKEMHIKTPGGAESGPRDFVSTDNDKGIPSHFTPGGPFSAYIPRVEACSRSAGTFLPRGTSFSLYNRVTTLQIVPHIAAYRQIVAAVARHIQAATGGGSTSPDAPTVHPTVPPGAAPSDFVLSAVEFRGANISGWAETIRMSNVKIGDKHVTWETDPVRWGDGWWLYKIGRAPACGNPWVFVKRDGKWRACTYEWCRVGCHDRETAKLMECFGGLKSGETIGLCVAGLSRDWARNEAQRSNIVWVKVP